MIYWPTKTTEEVKDRGLDWGPIASKIGNPAVVASVWTKLRGEAAAAIGSIDPDGQRVYTRVSGGAPNAETVFRNTVTFANGQIWSVDVFMRTRA